jgi:hypothetical protein
MVFYFGPSLSTFLVNHSMTMAITNDGRNRIITIKEKQSQKSGKTSSHSLMELSPS